jgi:hypothetical protein
MGPLQLLNVALKKGSVGDVVLQDAQHQSSSNELPVKKSLKDLVGVEVLCETIKFPESLCSENNSVKRQS